MKFSIFFCIIEEESTQDNTEDNGSVCMGNYQPPFTITDCILSYVLSISEKIRCLDVISHLETTVLGEQKEIQEVKNAYAAYEKFSEINPYSLQDLQRFHGIMTKYLVQESGTFRHGEEGVFSDDRCIFMAPPIEQNLIRMTIPDKPNSKKQRYVKI